MKILKNIVLILLLFCINTVYAEQTIVNNPSDSFGTAWNRQQAMNTELYNSIDGLTIGEDVQAFNAELEKLANATPPSERSLYYFNGVSTEWVNSLKFDIILETGINTSGSLGKNIDKLTLRNNANDTTLNFTDDSSLATEAIIDASGFDGNLATTDDTVQEVAQALDDLVASGGLSASADETISGDWEFTGDITIGNLANNSITADMYTDEFAYDYIPISYMKDGTTAPENLDDATSRSPYSYRNFDGATQDEDLNFIWHVPNDLSGTTVQYRVKYLVTNATGPSAEGVVFALSGVSIGDGDVTNGTKCTPTNNIDSSVTAAQWVTLITDWSNDVNITNLTAGETTEINFMRDFDNALDTYAQDVGVFAIEIRYVKNPAR